VNYNQLRKLLEDVNPWLSKQPHCCGACISGGSIIVRHSKDMSAATKKEIATELGDVPVRFEEKLR